LHRRGWGAPHWPVDLGGTGWSPLWQFLFDIECCIAGAPLLPLLGTKLVAPLIYRFGSEEQRRTHLPSIISGQRMWCQGFSEPNSGSDLFSLRTSAVLDGNEYVINGQKIWTTNAHAADGMFLLAKTGDSGDKKRDFSFFLFDMKLEGISVKPIPSIDWQHHLNEVVFTDLRIPKESLVGQPGDGWGQANAILQNERIGNARVPELRRDIIIMRRLAETMAKEGSEFAKSELFEQQFADLEIAIRSLEWCALRTISNDTGRSASAMVSALKLYGSQLQQDLAQLAAELAGPKLLRNYRRSETETGEEPAAGIATYLMYRRAASIYAGTSEIQKTLLAKLCFGLS